MVQLPISPCRSYAHRSTRRLGLGGTVKLTLAGSARVRHGDYKDNGVGSRQVWHTRDMIQPASVVYAQEQPTAAEDELQGIQQTLAQAWLSKDRAALEGLLAPEWSVTDISGNVLSRDTVLKDLDTGNRVIESVSIDDVRVRVYGSTAVVTGRTTASGRYQGQEASVQLRFTDVFVNTAGAWKAVASHSTEIRQPR